MPNSDKNDQPPEHSGEPAYKPHNPARPAKAEFAPPASLPPQARRALEEAAARRAAQDAEDAATDKQKEIGGRKGPDPVRYGDWEKKGIASDF